MPDTASPVPDFTKWPSFPFEGDLRVKQLDPPVDHEPARKGEDAGDCSACNAPDEAYIWVSERWRVRAMDRPTGLPMVLILESRSHLDLGDLPNLLAAELGVMTVRLERAVRSLDGVARVHVNRWGDGSAHLHMWFLARPHGRLQLRGTFLSLWDDILPPIPESTWRENLALVAAWLAEFGGRPLAEPPRIDWQAPSSLLQQAEAEAASLARLAEADDTSVALLEAPLDEDARLDEEAPFDEPATGSETTGSETASNQTPSNQTANRETGRSETASDPTNGSQTASDPTAEAPTANAPTTQPTAHEPTADRPAASGATTDNTATGETAGAGETGAQGTNNGAATAAAAKQGPPSEAPKAAGSDDSEAATVDLARQAPGSPPVPTVPAARAGDQPEAHGSKPEPQGAPT